ncbi:hypothetical protein D3C87_1752800 [compost metagenome]
MREGPREALSWDRLPVAIVGAALMDRYADRGTRKHPNRDGGAEKARSVEEDITWHGLADF